MDPSAIVRRTWRTARSLLEHLWDAVPPYRWIEGNLVAKEAAPDGRYLILVDEEPVHVDAFTFDKLMVGEPLRVRCTRQNRAISIDRLVP